ncbi:hypothetical protein [Thermoclostridium caenicola]|uniref:Uncharacterized protein n=1 Tax=Thermoclostridium caenicola TaxID=659425 RepID=A0A1M6DE89_9FIRM|nr:hypothetical protein [Thermoclostridium caenicola]SHI71604.1 hypothetical protein SAMN05444373_100758 [Thermoclostridium caenicola]
MKTGRIMAICCIMGLAVMAILVSALFFPLRESDLCGDTLKRAGQLYRADIVDFALLDSKCNNNGKAFIYRFRLENGTEMNYAVSYYKHFAFPRYRFASYADYSRPDFSGVLIAEGIPYETVYDITDYVLKYKDSTLNRRLMIMLISSAGAAFIFAMLWFKRRYSGKNV